MLGDVYFWRNDSVGQYEKLDIAPMTYVEACNTGIEMGSGVSLQKWMDTLTNNPPKFVSLERAIGLPREKIDRIIKADYAEGCALLDEELDAGAARKVKIRVP